MTTRDNEVERSDRHAIAMVTALCQAELDEKKELLAALDLENPPPYVESSLLDLCSWLVQDLAACLFGVERLFAYSRALEERVRPGDPHPPERPDVLRKSPEEVLQAWPTIAQRWLLERETVWRMSD